MTTNRLLERFRAGQPLIGAWCVTGAPLAAELLAAEGFDYLCADCQHGLMSYDAMIPVLQAVARTGVTPVVRVARNDTGDIGKVLDGGAETVIVPMVNSRDEAELAVAACRYAPEGTRSFGPVRSALFLGADPTIVNRQVACLVMIETITAVEAADEICSTPGVDGIYVGPADLAITMGLSPSFLAPSKEHADAIETVRLACERAGILAGVHTGGGQQAEAYLDQGFNMVTISTDAALLRSTAREELAVARRHHGQGEGRPASAGRAGYS
ncbi:MAG TPA: aldolase/citrate lyase family protein [Acidimicrobiales bacterium]|nr:aldolase/citrate lyase family protein [Acidimicrobiales bacterium]